MRDVKFKPGDRITIKPLPVGLRKSLPASKILSRTVVEARDEGRSGGLDVYDGVGDDGREVSFYGTQVVQVRRAGKGGRATNRVAAARSSTYRKGDRVQLHPGTDLWMRGARYGTVTRPSYRNGVMVKIDKLGRSRVLRETDLMPV